MATLEERRLLNPAFVGTLLLRAAIGHVNEVQRPLPYVHTYLIPPLLLHRETRERLPQSVVTTLVTWVERNSDLLMLLPRRIAELAPTTRDALLFITATKAATLGTAGEVEPLIDQRCLVKFEKETPSPEVSDCLRRAHFVGRWLGSAGSIPTVLTALGVQL